jgi:hypothetical protein
MPTAAESGRHSRKRIKVTSEVSVRIHDTSRKIKRVDPKVVARELGATAEVVPIAKTSSLLTKQLIISTLLDRIRTIGGRPGLSNTETRSKIPLTSEDIANLKLTAEILSKNGQKVALGQVASILLSQSLKVFLHTHRNELQATDRF